MLPFISEIIVILHETPSVVHHLVYNLDEKMIHANEGPGTWSPHDVVAHLIFGEQTDWIPRMQIILGDQEANAFTPFDRNGHFSLGEGRSIRALLHQFRQLRNENIDLLSSENITYDDLMKTGIHPAFGPVTLKQLLAAWAVHDMTHIHQISRVIAKQYEAEVGPWKAYMGVLKN